MKNKINVANLLKDMPKGIKLYDWLHNIDVELDEVATTEIETVIWCTKKDEDYNELFGYSQLGTLRGWFDGLQILFPSKEMRDWSKFLWKKGDVLANGEGDYCVFKEFAHSSYQTVKAVFVKRNKESIHSDSCLLDTKDWHKASHSCTATYINTIEKELSGKLNMETLEIEKAQPVFKDGDDKHIVYPLNFMPRKECCCELDYDLSDKGQKEEYLKQLRDSQERLKILSLLLHKQEEEVIEFGYPKTTCYYPDLNCLKEIDFKEDKQ